MSTNLEYRERERQAKLNEKKSDGELEREIRSHFFVGRTLWICSGGEEMRNATGHPGKWVALKKKWTRTSSTFPPLKCNQEVSGRFTLVSCKLRQINVREKCAARAKFFFFCWLDLLLFFHRSCCLCHLALLDFIFSLSKLKILSRASLLAQAKSI